MRPERRQWGRQGQRAGSELGTSRGLGAGVGWRASRGVGAGGERGASKAASRGLRAGRERGASRGVGASRAAIRALDPALTAGCTSGERTCRCRSYTRTSGPYRQQGSSRGRGTRVLQITRKESIQLADERVRVSMLCNLAPVLLAT